jgi:hypothetical protein
MSDTHAARPTDLVALVTFDEEVRENQAVTRERLGLAPDAPRPLNAALEQWLGLGRHTWITVRGRQVHGIATARELSAKSAWQIDTLIDVDTGEADGGDVLGDLLRQAVVAAQRARVTHILLRTPADSPAVEPAMRAGFVRALEERLWTGTLAAPGEPPADDSVRRATRADTMSLFQLYSRTLPIETRQALAMTLSEWQALRERRWCSRGTLLVGTDRDQIVGSLQLSHDGRRPQIDLMLNPSAAGLHAGAELLTHAATQLAGADVVLALAPTACGATEQLLRDHGMQPSDEFILLSRRIARPQREAVRKRAGIAVPTRG